MNDTSRRYKRAVKLAGNVLAITAFVMLTTALTLMLSGIFARAQMTIGGTPPALRTVGGGSTYPAVSFKTGTTGLSGTLTVMAIPATGIETGEAVTVIARGGEGLVTWTKDGGRWCLDEGCTWRSYGGIVDGQRVVTWITETAGTFTVTATDEAGTSRSAVLTVTSP